MAENKVPSHLLLQVVYSLIQTVSPIPIFFVYLIRI